MSGQQNPTHSCHDLDLQQRINGGLLDLTSSLLVGLEPAAQLKHKVFLALSHKCFTTAEAIRCLCDQNLHDDAFALLRVLMEAVIDAVYILESDEQIASDYMDYPKFRMWYQSNVKNPEVASGEGMYTVTVAYAESTDGIRWEKPALDLFAAGGEGM